MKRPGLSLAFLPATLFALTGLHAAEVSPAVAATAPATSATMQTKVERAPEATPAMRGLRAEEILKQFDKNGDGRLDDDERALAHEAMLDQQEKRRAAKEAALNTEVDQSFRRRVLEQFDKNHDGKLDDAERAEARSYFEENGIGQNPAVRAELLKRFDRNGDGRLDETERTEMQRFLQNRPAKAGGPLALREEILRRFDHNGDGRIDDAEWAELEPTLRARIEAAPLQLRRYDKNGDGRIDDTEWIAARQQIRDWLNDPQAFSGRKKQQAALAP